MTFNEAMEKAGVNMDETLRRFGGNSALLERFMRHFVNDPSFADLQNATKVWAEATATGESASMDDILRAAHTLKGTSGNLGLTTLYTWSTTIVDICRSGHTDKLQAAFDGLFQEYTNIMSLLGQLD